MAGVLAPSPILDPMITRAVGVVALGLFGLVVAGVGTGAHRSWGYAGVALGLILVAAGAVFARVWMRWPGYIAYAVAWVVAIEVLRRSGAGGSVLLPENDLRAQIWVAGGGLMLGVVAAIPRFVFVGRDVAS